MIYWPILREIAGVVLVTKSVSCCLMLELAVPSVSDDNVHDSNASEQIAVFLVFFFIIYNCILIRPVNGLYWPYFPRSLTGDITAT